MLAASPIPQDLMSKQLQMQAQNDLDQARLYKAQSDLEQAQLYKAQYFKIALTFYDRAKVTFRNIASARELIPLSELKKAFSRAYTSQTPEDESLRQRIAEVYFERAEILESLKKWDKAKKSYEKAQKWSDEAIPADSTSSANHTVNLAKSTEFFPSRAFLSPKASEVCQQEKHQWVAQVFETILKQFQDLDLCQSSPSLFLVYAHNNKLGKADAEVSQRVIQWLSSLRSNLYSDRSASGHQALPLPATPEDIAKVNDILSSQLCLLPNHAGTVDQVIMCGSELLGHYMASSYYQDFCKEIQSTYKEVSERTNDFSQVEAAIRKVVEANLNEEEFHHVLTELAFLQIRYEHKKSEHRIIPLLLNSTAQQCLPKFIVDSTTIRIEDSKWRTPSNWKGQTYRDEGLHIAFFKLLNRLLGEQKRCIPLMEEKVYRACLQKLQENHAHTLTAEAFSLFLNQTCVTALEALKQDHGSDLRELNVQKAYESLLTEIKQINGEYLVAPDQLRSILEASYSSERLAIQRLSGLPLSMEHCYINLAVVEQEKEKVLEEEEKLKQEEKEKFKESRATQNHFHRLPSFEAIHSNLQKLVPLEKLFDPRELSQGKMVTPRRILIRGRAGVGKTTLSKKIVYEYTQKGQWRDRFDYVLWVPLRTLKGRANCDLATLFHETYFPSYPKGQSLAKTLAAQINGPAKDKTLFVLDGWDEIAQEWGEHELMSGFLKQLLNQPAVLITSRPYVDLGQADPMDLELETVGFSPENVTAYLSNPGIVPTAEGKEIKHFIQTNAFIQELVNALCYSWDEIKRMQKEAPGAMTVTALYQAMMSKLWRKDMLHLGKLEGRELLTASHINALSSFRLEKLVKAEQDFLSTLAFQGLQRNQIEFHRHDLHKLVEQLETQGVDLPFTLEANLEKLSFLHADDAEASQCSYHFMHLTFQEFFAAKFLVKHLQAHATIIGKHAAVSSIQAKLGVAPSLAELKGFIAAHKYNPHYEIVWWMVAGLLKGNVKVLHAFFDLLEQEPQDLLGVQQQRLMMGCLQEARPELDAKRARILEDGLVNYLCDEISRCRESYDTCKSHLGSQPTFPEYLLLFLLKTEPSQDLRIGIINTLKNRPILSSVAIDALTAALQDRRPDVRLAAAKALGEQPLLPVPTIRGLITLLQDSELWNPEMDISVDVEGEIQEMVLPAWSPITDMLQIQTSLPEEAVKDLIALLQEGNIVQHAAIQILDKQSFLSDEAISGLLTLLYHEEEIQSAAIYTLGNQPSLPSRAVKELIALLRDKNTCWKAARAAAYALANQQFLPNETIESLVILLKNSDAQNLHIAVTLGKRSLPDQILKEVCAFLQTSEIDVNDAFISHLADQRFLSNEAVEYLIARLKDNFYASTVLKKCSSLSLRALKSLLTLMQEKNENFQRAATDVLAQQQSLPSQILQNLIALLKNADAQQAAFQVLENQRSLPHQEIESLISLLRDWNVRWAASAILKNQICLLDEAVMSLMALLKNADVRSVIIEILGQKPPLPLQAFQGLSALLKDRGIQPMGNEVLDKPLSLSEAIKGLHTFLQSRDQYIQQVAISALGTHASLPEETVMSLIALLKEGVLCWPIAKALSNQQTLSPQALKCLITLFSGANSYTAAKVLEKHSPLPLQIVRDLITLLHDEVKPTRFENTLIADIICKQPSIPAQANEDLIPFLQSEDYYLRKMAAFALGTQPALSEEIAQRLIVLLSDENEEIRQTAIKALEQQQSLPSQAIKNLVTLLKNRSVYWSVDKILKAQSSIPPKALESLIMLLGEDDYSVRSSAYGILKNQLSLPPQAVESLIRLLKEKQGSIWDIKNLLCSFSDALYPLLPTLEPALFQLIYSTILVPESFKKNMPLYIQNGYLYFYSSKSRRQSIWLKAGEAHFRKKIEEAERTMNSSATSKKRKRSMGRHRRR